MRMPGAFPRRDALKMLTGVAAAPLLPRAGAQPQATRFQLACMTLPYSGFPLERASQTDPYLRGPERGTNALRDGS